MEMSEENGARVTLATLGAQVTSLDRDYNDLKRALVALDTRLDASIASLGTRFEASLSALANKVDQKSTTQWPTIIGGFALTVTVLGGLITILYGPIQRDTNRLDGAVAAILDRGIFSKAYEADQKRVTEDIQILRAEFQNRVTLQRYTSDQERISHALDEMRSRFASKAEMEAIFKERQRQVDTDSQQIENVRLRSYDHFGKLMKLEQAISDLDRRFNAISQRVIELNNKIQGFGR